MPIGSKIKKSSLAVRVLLWIVAIAITVFAAGYQESSGPSYPVEGLQKVAGESLEYSFPASHGGPGGQIVEIPVVPGIEGKLQYKRHKMDESWITLPMEQRDGRLFAELPHQPPAGKLDYRVKIATDEGEVTLPPDRNVVIRFRGDVPGWILVLHIFFMFFSLLFGTRAGLEALQNRGNPIRYAVPAAFSMLLGGMILGPIVQKYAFGAFWTGFPFGHDLTDNKTLISMLGWTAALLIARRGKFVRSSVLAAVILTWVIFLIPHSMMGSELDYSTLDENPPVEAAGAIEHGSPSQKENGPKENPPGR